MKYTFATFKLSALYRFFWDSKCSVCHAGAFSCDQTDTNILERVQRIHICSCKFWFLQYLTTDHHVRGICLLPYIWEIDLREEIEGGPNGGSKILSGDWVTFHWHLGFPPPPVRLPCLAAGCIPSLQAITAQGLELYPTWQDHLWFLTAPPYSSGIRHPNLTVVCITLKPSSKCGLYRVPNIC